MSQPQEWKEPAVDDRLHRPLLAYREARVLMTMIAALVEQIEWWLAELGRVTSGRASKAAYAAEWQLCRAATWLRDEE